MRRMICLLGLLATACATTRTGLPWVDLRAEWGQTRLRVTTQHAGMPEPLHRRIAAPDVQRILSALDRSSELPGPPAHPSVSTIRHLLDFQTGKRAWHVALENQQVFVLRRGGQTRYFRASALRTTLAISLTRAQPDVAPHQRDAPDELAGLAAAIEQWLQTQRQLARTEQAERAVLIFTTACALRPWPGKPPVSGKPGTWLAVGLAPEAARDTFSLPEGLRVYPSYPSFWLHIGRTGVVSFRGATDRALGLGGDDPERRQPYPAHFDLVIDRPGSTKKLYLDLKPGQGRVDYRVYP